MNKIPQKMELLLLLLVSSGCQQSQSKAYAFKYDSAPPPNIITVPFHSETEMTDEQIETIRTLLSKNRKVRVEEVESLLPKGFGFLGVSYELISPSETSDAERPFTRSTYVCRMSKKNDLVLIHENRQGNDFIQDWYIRDLALMKQKQTTIPATEQAGAGHRWKTHPILANNVRKEDLNEHRLC